MFFYFELYKFEKEGIGDFFVIIYWIKIDFCILNFFYIIVVGFYVLFFVEILSCNYNLIINKI